MVAGDVRRVIFLSHLLSELQSKHLQLCVGKPYRLFVKLKNISGLISRVNEMLSYII